MKQGIEALYSCITNNKNVLFNIDCDCDGYTAGSIVMNYLYKKEPEWVKEHVSYIHHQGKQHGLADILDKISDDISLVMCFDSSSNDIEEHKYLYNKGIQVFCGDHHECSQEVYKTSPAIICNVQTCNYPNKALTGAGVAYKFISAMEDLIYHGNQPTEFMDLCAIGNAGDMGLYIEKEIRAIMNIGLNRIHNKFLKYIIEKHDYSIQKMNGINYYSMAFYCVPYLNAVTRSATMGEKDIVFKGMLVQYQDELVESSKRGEKDQLVPYYEEAVTIAERVKRRQTKYQDDMMLFFDNKIEEEHLNDNAIILILCDKGEIDKSLAGLLANKYQAKLQKPCLILSKSEENGKEVYAGSGRNYSLSEITDLKEQLEKTNQIEWCAGHSNAFGCAIAVDKIDKFLAAFNQQYKNVNQTPIYWVDYIWDINTCDYNKILDIGGFDIYGQGIPESMVCLKDINLSACQITLMGLEKGHPTLKIVLPNGVSVIKFKSSEEEYVEFTSPDMKFTCIAKPSKNEWQGNITPQLLVEDYNLREEWDF